MKAQPVVLLPLLLHEYAILVEAAKRPLVSTSRGGGGSLYELNPNYVPYRTEVHQEIEAPRRHDKVNQFENVDDRPWSAFTLGSSGTLRSSASLQLYQGLLRLKAVSPSLFYTTICCVAVFVLWQLPFMQTVLHQHFVLSRSNLASRRLPCILLSAVSHSGFIHMMGNILVLLTFGPSVKQMLRTDIWPLLLGAAVAGSLSFLLLDQRHNGSLGLSGVTLAIVAVYTRLLPKKRLTTVIAGLVPVQLEAQRLLSYLLATSVFGIFIQKQSPIAHSSHLGGLLFGIVYYEVWRRCVQPSSRKWDY